ncbi:DUF2691 family protein [Paenibacillus jiagnxiensis]|uniref:DUF2691 family protein n=1 Tax=Paenibacillus jiagnxiensis TaxID=3228926 RepID=UPI0033B2A579
MKRGISLEIPNEYGSFLGEILGPFDMAVFNWYTGGEESYLVKNGELRELLPRMIEGMDGRLLKDILENNTYYLIFADLKAFPKGEIVTDLRTYEEFVNSDCQLVLLVVDSVYVTIYCKEEEKVDRLYYNAKIKGYDNVDYITDENDFRTRLSVW